MRGFAGLRGGFRLRQVLLRRRRRDRKGGEVAEAAGLGRELLLVALDIGDFLVEPRQPVVVAANGSFELVAPGGQVRECRGEFGEQALGRCERGLGLGHALVDAGALLDAQLDLFLQLGILGVEALQGLVGIRDLLLLAGDVGGELSQTAVELGDAFFGALLLAVELLARIGETLQPGGGAGLGLAQRRQFGGALGLDAGGLGLLAGAFGHLADGDVMGVAGLGDIGIGAEPAQVKQHGLGLAHLGCDLAIADRLPRLPLQAFHLPGELPDDILDAGEVGFGRPQAKFGLVAARMQAGDAGGVFQHAAALFGLGLDDLADLALVNKGGRTRAGRRIRKQELHVAGAHVAAVDAIDGTRLALDAAGDFQNLTVVDGGRRGAIGIVDRHHDFGVIARRTIAGTGEDYGVHVGGAQRLV